MTKDQYHSEVYVMSTDNSVTLFKTLCMSRLGLIGRHLLEYVDTRDFVRNIFTSLLTPLVERDQTLSTGLFQGCVDKLIYESGQSGLTPEMAYDVVAGTEAFVLRAIVDTIPHVDDDDFHIDSITFGNDNTVLIYAYRQKDTCAANTGHKAR